MPRPAAVTASAVVAMLGSLLVLLLAAIMVVAAFVAPMPEPAMRGPVIAAAVLLTALAGLGIATGLGVLRLRPWARMSMLVFGGITAVGSFFGALVLAFVPVPPTPGAPVSESSVRVFMVGFYVIPMLIGAWWLILFNRPAAKHAFLGGAAATPSRRPLAISILAWIFLIGGASTFLVSLTGMPALIVTFVFEGWAARVVYAVMAAIGLYLGWGLLKLDERARIVSLVWSGLGLLHGAYFMISPAARQRMNEVQAMYPPGGVSNQPGVPDAAAMTAFTQVIMAVSLLVIVAGMWLLVRYKDAFQTPPDVSSPLPPPPAV